MSDKKTTGFALVPKPTAKDKEPSKIFGVETRTLLAIGALGLGTYLMMTHDPLEDDDGLAPEKDLKEPDWWREARANDRIAGVRGARRAGNGFDAGQEEVDRLFAEVDAVERDELAAMNDDSDEEDSDEEADDEVEEDDDEDV